MAEEHKQAWCSVAQTRLQDMMANVVNIKALDLPVHLGNYSYPFIAS